MSGYDLIAVGGGLGGAALGKAMAEHGTRVLVLERERRFGDRVRGEAMAPWGVEEARRLGIYDLLREACGHEVPWWDIYLGPMLTVHRDLLASTLHAAPFFTFYHPTMQEILLQAAADAGAEVRRSVRVRDVLPGPTPRVVIECEGQSEEIAARLVVGADGRASLVRKWGGFTPRRDAQHMLISGLLLDDVPAPEDTCQLVLNPAFGQGVILFPQGRGRARGYLMHQQSTNRRFQGEGDVAPFLDELLRTGAAPEHYRGARPAGPLATFEGADTWVEHPYRDGLALVGDAASASDPSWGQGVGLTLRDVRVLRDHLLAAEDWDAAGHAYAAEHDRHYGTIHQVDNWFSELFYRLGPEADARRERALPLAASDPTRFPDQQVSGPDLPADETAWRRMFGEE